MSIYTQDVRSCVFQRNSGFEKLQRLHCAFQYLREMMDVSIAATNDGSKVARGEIFSLKPEDGR